MCPPFSPFHSQIHFLTSSEGTVLGVPSIHLTSLGIQRGKAVVSYCEVVEKTSGPKGADVEDKQVKDVMETSGTLRWQRTS